MMVEESKMKRVLSVNGTVRSVITFRDTKGTGVKKEGVRCTHLLIRLKLGEISRHGVSYNPSASQQAINQVVISRRRGWSRGHVVGVGFSARLSPTHRPLSMSLSSPQIQVDGWSAAVVLVAVRMVTMSKPKRRDRRWEVCLVRLTHGNCLAGKRDCELRLRGICTERRCPGAYQVFRV